MSIFGFAEPCSGLGSVVVYLATLFGLWKGVSDGSMAIAIVQAGIFADASRQVVKYKCSAREAMVRLLIS
jgi:hypothetical protein